MASGRSSEFAGATTPREDADYLLTGAPLDVTATGRPGTRTGPGAIRRASRQQEGYDHRTGTAFADLGVHDAGDLRGWPDPAEYVDHLAGDLAEHCSGTEVVPILLGGEHTVSLAGVRATDPGTYVALDAHLDLRDAFDGLRVHHATVARRALEHVDRVVILGARSGGASEWERAEGDDVTVVPPPEVADWEPTTDGSIYLSVDVDAVDPAAAPATGTTVPGGLHSGTALRTVARLAPLARGFDVVEVGDWDAGETAALGASLVRRFVHAHAAGNRD